MCTPSLVCAVTRGVFVWVASPLLASGLCRRPCLTNPLCALPRLLPETLSVSAAHPWPPWGAASRLVQGSWRVLLPPLLALVCREFMDSGQGSSWVHSKYQCRHLWIAQPLNAIPDAPLSKSWLCVSSDSLQLVHFVQAAC